MLMTAVETTNFSDERMANIEQKGEIVAFVNELVPEEQKTKFDPKVFHSPWTPRRPIEPYRWVIDRERDIFMVRLGGDGSSGDPSNPITKTYLALVMRGEVIKFDAAFKEAGNWKEGIFGADWEVTDVYLPPSLADSRDTVLELIKEALEAFGTSGGNREWLSSVSVRFNQQ
ncbi:MAG: hypothetical protein U1E04_07695 [Hylemonella sp.]|nr:hypothetical protein [Hylemonella sp.]